MVISEIINTRKPDLNNKKDAFSDINVLKSAFLRYLSSLREFTLDRFNSLELIKLERLIVNFQEIQT